MYFSGLASINIKSSSFSPTKEISHWKCVVLEIVDLEIFFESSKVRKFPVT